MRPSAPVVAVLAALALASAAPACEPAAPPPDDTSGPSLTVSPETCDFGPVPIGTVGRCALTITNVGDAPATLTAATSGPPFAVVGVNGTLAPGASREVFAQAVPQVVGVREGAAAFGPGRVEVELRVEGVPAGSPALEITQTPPGDVEVGAEVSLTVEDFSIDDVDVAFEWSLVASPPASTAGLGSPTSRGATLVPDVAGEYSVAVTMTSNGVSRDGQVTVTAVPLAGTHDIVVTLTGDDPSLALRVHRLADDACSSEACSTRACEVTWGADSADNTVVVFGATESLRIAVHRDAGEGEGEGAAATVRVLVDGALADELFATLAPADAWEVADVVIDDEGANVAAIDVVTPASVCP